MFENNQACRQMIIALYEIPGIGWHAIQKAVAHELWKKEDWSQETLLGIGLKRNQAQKAEAMYRDKPWLLTEADSPAIMESGAVTLTPYDEAYPAILKETAQPPWVLYAKGRLELLHRPSVSIVGTRKPTAYGRHSAASMAEELSAAGITVVSGLARGIDHIAHVAALKHKGSTVAVLPTPINRCYPPEHESLYKEIAGNGLLLSETPLGTALHPGQFHQRNRIISALCQAVIVVEGARKSGSMITAKHALEMDRELFALPGPISSPMSEGPNELIKEGKARLMTSVSQIFDELPWLRNYREEASAQAAGLVQYGGEGVAELSGEEAAIIELLRDRPMSLDEMHELLMIPFGHLNALLLNLCIKRRIELQLGSIYIAL
ncbi:DNA-processing protein DprA [Paenibacillus sp. HB172176]|uniref:DNA-processing protein DprA n=1 Tax=Paenibacillus sp. HB172176 TaxID=2493690 RepID=UPI00143BC507|nr:DNA-processing protein DprA [Paenibacillus sp. HB172176]